MRRPNSEMFSYRTLRTWILFFPVLCAACDLWNEITWSEYLVLLITFCLRFLLFSFVLFSPVFSIQQLFSLCLYFKKLSWTAQSPFNITNFVFIYTAFQFSYNPHLSICANNTFMFHVGLVHSVAHASVLRYFVLSKLMYEYFVRFSTHYGYSSAINVLYLKIYYS